MAERNNWSCQSCGHPLSRQRRLNIDHKIALINGGENRENNLQPLCRNCHGDKTAADVREKSLIYRKRVRAAGLRKPKGRPMPGTKASGIRKW